MKTIKSKQCSFVGSPHIYSLSFWLIHHQSPSMVIDIWWHYKICASYRTSPEKRCKCRKRDCNKKQGTATTGLQFFLRFPPPTPTPQGTNERTKTNIAKQTVTRTTHFASRCCRTPSRAACNEPREPPYTGIVAVVVVVRLSVQD